jgi:hypothetical protein
MTQMLRNLVRRLMSRVYLDETVVLLEHRARTAQASPARIVRANQANIADVLMFQDRRYLRAFRRFLASGDLGYLGYLGDRCVHRSWVRLGPRRVQLHKFAALTLRPGEAFIEYCETAPEARGRNIYAHVLCRVVEDLGPGTRVLISTNERNGASLRGIGKAGFIPLEKVRVRVLLGIVSRRRCLA